MKKSKLGLAALAAASIFALAACSNSASNSSAGGAKAKAGDFELAYKNPDKTIKGGDLKVAEVSDSPMKAEWLAALSEDKAFSNMVAPSRMLGSIFDVDSSFRIIDGGPADIKFDEKGKSATITLHKDLKWSDGSDVTAKDYEFNYELYGNQAYGSSRWSESLLNIEGMEEYHANPTSGDGSQISGITFPDGPTGKTIKVQFKANKPGFTQSGNGYFLESVAPYNYLKDIKPEALISDPKTTTEPLVYGPFKPAKVVSGESVKLVPNQYWYGAKPKLDSVTYSMVAPTKAVAALKAKTYDFLTNSIPSLYADIKKLDNYAITGQQELYLELLYFNLGQYDKASSTNVMNRETPLQDKAVRQAIGYARNVEEVNKKFSNGLKSAANSTIPPVFSDFTDPSVKAYEKQELEKAKKLLDGAGWKLNEKTGYREKDGKELSLVYAARSGNANSETIAQNYIQQWKKIGVKVSLYEGKLMEFNAWGDMMTGTPSNQKWDMTDGAWSLSSEPSQQDLFSAAAPFNFGHFVDETITKDMNDIDSEKSMEQAYRKKSFVKYQKDLNEKAYIIPTSFAYAYTPVNKRVSGFSMDNAIVNNSLWTDLGVSSKILK
jgi:peptide/nickel transport system substrate-binding protein